ncbi:hypothetical protein [Janthinobacterium sp.]|uniref:hypothetical protein n=1 Tax=Janthinobacterium sp. TaxID=1871054 RepID=UPI00293DA0D2|nr:hypothetical protein [Janthinobacterium sp.]
MGKLREQGASRLSLHPAAGLPDVGPLDFVWAERVFIVRFRDRHQCWALGEEQTQWRNNAWRSDDDGRPHRYPDATHYGGEVDCYWLVKDAAGVPEVPETRSKNWPRPFKSTSLQGQAAPEPNPCRPTRRIVFPCLPNPHGQNCR